MDDLGNIFPTGKPNGSSKAFSFGEVEERLPMDTRKALIDGDMLVYACCFAAAKNDMPLEEVITIFNQKMRDLLYFSRSAKCQIYLTADDKSNYRYEVATRMEYKGNRADKDKPPHYTAFRAWLEKHRKGLMSYGEEADDRMGIHQQTALDWLANKMADGSIEIALRSLEEEPENWPHTCICTDDKDLDMIPGWHYRLRTQECYFCPEPGYVDTDSGSKLKGAGFLFFCAQLLTGDSTDNIPGVGYEANTAGLNEIKASFGVRKGRGFGPKGAQGVLGGVEDPREAMWRVVQVYRAAHPKRWRKYLLEAARLLWIRRYDNEMWSFPPPITQYIKERLDAEKVS